MVKLNPRTWVSWIKRGGDNRKPSREEDNTKEVWRDWFERWLGLYEDAWFAEAYTVCHEMILEHPRLLNIDFVCVRLAELEFLGNRDPRGALALLDRAREQGFSEAIRYYHTRCMAEREIGRYAAAKYHFQKYACLDPKLAHSKWIASCLAGRGDDRALAICQAILEKEPHCCCAHIAMARDAIRAGDEGKALLLIRRAERLKPGTGQVYEIGCLYHELADFTSAIAAYRQVHDLGWDRKGDLFAAFASCYDAIGDCVEAKRYGQWALRCDPDSEYVQDVWACVSETDAALLVR